jgi:hypothetical protein
MWLTAACVAALSLAPGQDGLKIANVRSTYGVLGPTRPDAKITPGDSIFLNFDIEGVKPDAAGKVGYSLALEVVNKQGKTEYGLDTPEKEVLNVLGGTTVAAFAQLDVGLEQPAGDYTLKVTAKDKGSGKTATVSYPYTVLPRGFGIVRLKTTYDMDAVIPAPLLGDGQSVYVTFGVVGFTRDSAKKQPKLALQLRVLDDAGQPTAKPLTGEVKEGVDEKALGVPVQFLLPLNRPGKFTVEVEATDQLGKDKTPAKMSFPLTVQKIK